MNASPRALGGMGPLAAKPRRGYWRRFGGKFLLLSIAAHLLFLGAAAYLIVEYIVPDRRPMMASLPATNSVKAVAEHNATVTKQKEAASQPPLTRAVSVSRPDLPISTLPDLSANEALLPSQIPGFAGGTNPFPSGPGGPGNDSGGIRAIFRPDYHPGMLKGTFYDFKFQRNDKPAKNPDKDYAEDITHFVMNGWNDSEFDSKYLKGRIPLYATQVFFPVIDTNEGPRAFKSPKPDSPGKWIVIFKGGVSPPESGTYHFVAAGDDDMIIRFNQQTVLFHCEHIPTPPGLQGGEYRYEGERLSYARSLPLKVETGKTYPIEILIGDDIPFKTFAKVLIEKEGVDYAKDAGGGPILPVFAVDAVSVAPAETPAHLNGPVWHGGNSTLLEDMENR